MLDTRKDFGGLDVRRSLYFLPTIMTSIQVMGPEDGPFTKRHYYEVEDLPDP